MHTDAQRQKENLIDTVSGAANQVLASNKEATFNIEKEGFGIFAKWLDEEIKDLEEQIDEECPMGKN